LLFGIGEQSAWRSSLQAKNTRLNANWRERDFSQHFYKYRGFLPGSPNPILDADDVRQDDDPGLRFPKKKFCSVWRTVSLGSFLRPLLARLIKSLDSCM
jgi:hypothetical protein